MALPEELRRSAYSIPTEDRTQSSAAQARTLRDIKSNRQGLKDVYLKFLGDVGDTVALKTLSGSSDIVIYRYINEKYKGKYNEWIHNGQKFKTIPTLRLNSNTPL